MSARVRRPHEIGRLVTAAESAPGRIVLWVVGAGLLAWHGGVVAPVAFTAVMLDPVRKRLWLSVAAIGVVVSRVLEVPGLSGIAPFAPAWLLVASVAAVGIGGLGAVYGLMLARPLWPEAIRKHPVLTVHACIWLALAASAHPALAALGMAPFFAWRSSYLAASTARGRTAGTRFRDHLFYLVPAWGGTATPHGKGLEYLARHEADDSASLARARLAGLELLLLAVVWVFALDILDVLVFGGGAEHLAGPVGDGLRRHSLEWPRLVDAIRAEVAPRRTLGWAVAFLELVRATLALAAGGHVIVGALRLFGFHVPPNTDRPLLAESVVEFWNRFYFYFKELLVDFFFYPAYLRLRGVRPSIRLLAAVFAAAFFGNTYYHVLANPGPVVRLDFATAWAIWNPRLVYCFLLALGIWVSMLRQQSERARNAMPRHLGRLRRIAGVWTFYAVIQIWNVRGEGIDAWRCTTFFLSLLGG